MGSISWVAVKANIKAEILDQLNLVAVDEPISYARGAGLPRDGGPAMS